MTRILCTLSKNNHDEYRTRKRLFAKASFRILDKKVGNVLFSPRHMFSLWAGENLKIYWKEIKVKRLT